MGELSGTGQESSGDVLVSEILGSIATYEQCRLLELPPLAETVDSDRLAQLARDEGVTEVTFSYHDYHVRVEGVDDVRVVPEGEQPSV